MVKSQIIEKQDIAQDEALRKYKEAAVDLVNVLLSATKSITGIIIKMNSDDYNQLYNLLVNIKQSLLNVPIDSSAVDYIGKEPCIDTIYTYLGWINDVLLCYSGLVSETKSFLLIESLIKIMLQTKVHIMTLNKFSDNLSYSFALAENINKSKTK
jgi:hypothetical protein